MAVEKRYEIDGTYMNVISFGTGTKNLVIIAGVSLCGLEGQGNAVEQVYKSLADDYTIYLFDRKKVLPKDYRVEDMAEDIYRVLQMMGIDKTSLYGVSQGGMIAQCLAVKYPQLVEKMVLCSTLCKATDHMKKAAGIWTQLAEKEDVVAINRSFFELVYSRAFLDKNAELLPVLEKLGTADDCKRFYVLAYACGIFDISQKVSGIRCPVLVLGDINDRVTGVEGSREIVDKLGCDSYLYEQYSHAVYDEAPDIQERIKSFLQ